MTPAKPDVFASTLAPAGVELHPVNFASTRGPITPRAIHVHTNAASVESNVENAKYWAESAPGTNTLPHYQVDRTHDGVNRCWKLLSTSLRGIGSGTVQPTSNEWSKLTDEQRSQITAHGVGPEDVRYWTIVIETADTGYIADPTISTFDDGQVECIATILAYEAIVHGIPLVRQPNWWEPGVSAHTEPYGYPYTTLARGKICPGDKKKAQVWADILPRAIAIRDAWLAPPPPPDPGDGDLTPEQAQKLDDIHAALLADDYPFSGMVNMRTQVDRIYTIMNVFWDGFPGNIKDGPGVLARTIKNVAVKVGAKVG